MMRLAAIDIGTNSTKMTVADIDDDGTIDIVREESDVTRLGEGVDQAKRLTDDAMARTLDAVERFAKLARTDGAATVLAAGTSALRDAANGKEFLALAKERADVSIEIITGDREGQLAFAAVQSDSALSLPSSDSLLVFDIGGGSTEIILGSASGVHRHKSLNIGAVRLTERFLKSDPPTDAEIVQASAMADEMLAAVAKPATVPVVIGLGGTVVNLAAVTMGQTALDANSSHGTALSAMQIHNALERFRSVSLVERRTIPGLEPKRADVIIAGALLLERLLHRFGTDHFIVSARGLRYGLFADYAKRSRQPI